ncbi:Modular serine protease, partial [Eumeta japonica]
MKSQHLHLIAAAECFYHKEGKTQAPSEFVVVAGKLYRSFFNPNEDKEQISNVTEIKIPPRFFSQLTSYQDDIALVFLSTPYIFNNYVSPVCLNFDPTFDRIQLIEGRLGQ